MLKKFIIAAIRYYQRTASPELRKSCRFEPSCSEYMIAAVEKYGAIFGIWKGIKRILRCKPPNGGIDYP